MQSESQQSLAKRKTQQELREMGFPQTAILNALAVTNTQAEAINYILTTQLKEEDLPKQIIQMENDEDFEDEEEGHKMVFVIRMDLKLPFNKIVESVATAALQAYRQMQKAGEYDQFKECELYEWMQCGHRKIVLKANSENEILEIVEQAKSKNINLVLLRDYLDREKDNSLYKGQSIDKYQTMANQKDTKKLILAVFGPATESELDCLTKHLKLY